MPGPVGKRSDQKAGHRTAAELDVDRVEVEGAVQVPALGFEPRHAITRDLFQSAIDSAQSRYFEPTDWHLLRLLLLQVDAYVGSLMGAGARPSANQLDALLRGFSSLMFTEGDRRRLRIEIERTVGSVEVDSVEVTALADYREALGVA